MPGYDLKLEDKIYQQIGLGYKVNRPRALR